MSLSSESCEICDDLRRLRASSQTALCNARNLEEELNQTSAAYKLICYAVHVHLTNQHSETGGIRWAA